MPARALAAAVMLLAIPVAAAAQTAPPQTIVYPHPFPSAGGRPPSHRPGHGNGYRPGYTNGAVIVPVYAGTSYATPVPVKKPKVKPTKRPADAPDVFEQHSSTDANK